MASAIQEGGPPQRRGGIGAVLSAAGFILVVGLAIWSRLTSLEIAPYPQADEAFFTVEAARLATGGPLAKTTASGKPIDPTLALVGAPGHWLASPSFTLGRLP